MSTVNQAFADRIVKGGGWLDGDSDNSTGDNPRVLEVVRYDNAFGGVGFGLEFEGRGKRYVASEFVRNPTIYWSAQ